MAALYSNPLELIGKYVSFVSDDVDYIGVIDSVTFYLDGRHEISFHSSEFFDLSKISKLKLLGSVALKK